MSNKAVITAVTNQKGGTGKTTTCENLGVGLAMAGKKVLLVDTDPQASLTVALGHNRPDDLPVTLSDLMAKVIQDQPIAPGEGILHHPEGVDLVPANIALAGTEVSLVTAMSRETILKQYLDTVKKDYDFILLDGQLPDRDPLAQTRKEAQLVKSALAAAGWTGVVTPVLAFASDTFRQHIAEVQGAVVMNSCELARGFATERVVIPPAELERLIGLMESNS